MVWLMTSGVCFLALAAYVVLAERQGRPTGGTVHVLVLVSLGLTVVGAAVSLDEVLDDSGAGGLLLLLPPVLIAGALAGMASRLHPHSTPYRAGVWVGAALLAVWALLLGLGVGLVFLPAAVALLLAALVTMGPLGTGKRHQHVAGS